MSVLVAKSNLVANRAIVDIFSPYEIIKTVAVRLGAGPVITPQVELVLPLLPSSSREIINKVTINQRQWRIKKAKELLSVHMPYGARGSIAIIKILRSWWGSKFSSG